MTSSRLGSKPRAVVPDVVIVDSLKEGVGLDLLHPCGSDPVLLLTAEPAEENRHRRCIRLGYNALIVAQEICMHCKRSFWLQCGVTAKTQVVNSSSVRMDAKNALTEAVSKRKFSEAVCKHD